MSDDLGRLLRDAAPTPKRLDLSVVAHRARRQRLWAGAIMASAVVVLVSLGLFAVDLATSGGDRLDRVPGTPADREAVGQPQESAEPGEEQWVAVATRADARREGVLFIPDHDVFLVAEDAELTALSAWSPHPNSDGSGHRLLFCRRAQLFEGSHGEKFGRRGRYLGGPAPRDMDHIESRLRKEPDEVIIEIAPDSVSRGDPRPDDEKVEGRLDSLPQDAAPCSASGNPEEGEPGFAVEEETD